MGAIIVTPARGLLMGNRGILHDGKGNIVRRWAHQQWIHCVLTFKERKRTLMTKGRYTELFFLDEATALAAGHRPCGECQREKYQHFKGLLEQVQGKKLKSAEIDNLLHNERRIPYKRGKQWKQLVSAELGSLPTGVMIVHAGDPHLKLGDRLLRWTTFGYVDGGVMVSAENPVTLLTPPSITAILRLGYQPMLHPSAQLTQRTQTTL